MVASAKSLVFVTLAVVLSSCLAVSVDKTQCLNDHNEPVDWWIVYKMPSLSGKESKFTSAGFAYSYMDSDSADKTFELADQGLDKITGNALGNTLHPIFENKRAKDFAYVLYNDNPPGSDSQNSSRGHVKGVLAYGKTSGFWLVHSVPRYPDVTAKKFDFPDHERIYGQTFLCMSFPTDEFETIAQQLRYYAPDVYASYIPSALKGAAPSMAKVVDGDFVNKRKETDNIVEMETLGGVHFTSFAKSGGFGEDIYGALVAPHLKMDMLAETWRRKPFFEAYCRPDYKYEIYNVEVLKFTDDIEFPYTNDHSKWAISNAAKDAIVCLSDINRMPSQGKRGGGALCFKNKRMWGAFHSIVSEQSPCNAPKAVAAGEEEVAVAQHDVTAVSSFRGTTAAAPAVPAWLADLRKALSAQ